MSKRESTCISSSSRPTAIPANKRSSVNVLTAYAPRVAGEFLILTRSSHQILHEWAAEKSTFIRDVMRCG